jgi:hypothetical protein
MIETGALQEVHDDRGSKSGNKKNDMKSHMYSGRRKDSVLESQRDHPYRKFNAGHSDDGSIWRYLLIYYQRDNQEEPGSGL